VHKDEFSRTGDLGAGDLYLAHVFKGQWGGLESIQVFQKKGTPRVWSQGPARREIWVLNTEENRAVEGAQEGTGRTESAQTLVDGKKARCSRQTGGVQGNARVPSGGKMFHKDPASFEEDEIGELAGEGSAELLAATKKKPDEVRLGGKDLQKRGGLRGGKQKEKC